MIVAVVSFRIRPGCSHSIYTYLASRAEIERRNLHLEPKKKWAIAEYEGKVRIQKLIWLFFFCIIMMES